MTEPKKIGNGWAMQEWWEMREEVTRFLSIGYNYVNSREMRSDFLELIHKIDLLESKYKGCE
jgi:hypothetical protein